MMPDPTEKDEPIYEEPDSSAETSDEVILLAQLIMHEAGGEGTEGREAVAEVVINRMKSEKFPNDLNGVIYQNGQFSGNDEIAGMAVDDEAINIASANLNKYYSGTSEGDILADNVLYFRNPEICGASPTENWGKLPFYIQINHHSFYTG